MPIIYDKQTNTVIINNEEKDFCGEYWEEMIRIANGLGK